jgi:hypothetical protein
MLSDALATARINMQDKDEKLLQWGTLKYNYTIDW